MSTITIVKKNNNKEDFSIEKLTISFFKLTYLIGEPNIELAEKLSKTIYESLSKRRIVSLTQEELSNEITELLLERNHKTIYEAFINKNKKKQKKTQNFLKDKVLNYLCNKKNYLENIEILKDKFNDNSDLIDKIINYIDHGIFYPSTNILANTKYNYMVSSRNHTVEDKLEEICHILLKKVKNNKYNIPAAVNLSKIRSKEEIVSSINKKACGVKNVIDFYTLSQKLIIDNKLKNAKNLFYLTIEHPDIIELLKSNNFGTVNVVLLVPDRFMKNLQDSKKYYLKKEGEEYVESIEETKYLIDPETISNLLFSKIADNNVFDIVFIDKLNLKNSISENKIELSPVGYQPVYDEGGFLTGVVDVSKFVKEVGSVKIFDWNGLKNVIYDTMFFLDECFEKTEYIYEVHQQNIINTRKIFLSITGYHKLITNLEISYESDDSLLFAENLSEFLAYYSKKASIELSKDKRPFLDYNKSKFATNNFFNYQKGVQKTLFSELTKARKLLTNKPSTDWDELKNELKKYGIRNLTTYSILFSDIFSFANQTTNSINPPLHYKYLNVFNEKNILEQTNNQKINNSFLIKLHNVFEKFCDGVCNINYFYKYQEPIENIKKDFINTYISNNICFLPRIITDNDTFILEETNNKLLSI